MQKKPSRIFEKSENEGGNEEMGVNTEVLVGKDEKSNKCEEIKNVLN